jgi:D-galactose 1-dehydrogenase
MISLALVGLGKIARDQHIPAIKDNPAFKLVAAASPNSQSDDLPTFPDLDALLANGPHIDAIAICTPPSVRHAIAIRAIDAGLHVLLEKPPAATLSEVADMVAHAEAKGTTLFAAWHSREAAGVADARKWLSDKTVRSASIAWREDIRRWHPGQEWILGPGGFGVFDPGINALSILTAVLPKPVMLTSATMDVPSGRASPLAASLKLRSGDADIDAEFNFLQTGAQTWSMDIETDAGTLTLSEGGRVLRIGDNPAVEGGETEYPGLYRRFATLIETKSSEVDIAPIRLVADAFMIGERHQTDEFTF